MVPKSGGFMGRAPKQLTIKNNNQSVNSADHLTTWIHRDPHVWITRLLAVPVLEVSAGARRRGQQEWLCSSVPSATEAVPWGCGVWDCSCQLLSHDPEAVMKDVAFSGTWLRVAGFGCGRGVIFAEDNDWYGLLQHTLCFVNSILEGGKH